MLSEVCLEIKSFIHIVYFFGAHGMQWAMWPEIQSSQICNPFVAAAIWSW